MTKNSQIKVSTVGRLNLCVYARSRRTTATTRLWRCWFSPCWTWMCGRCRDKRRWTWLPLKAMWSVWMCSSTREPPSCLKTTRTKEQPFMLQVGNPPRFVLSSAQKNHVLERNVNVVGCTRTNLTSLSSIKFY